MVAQSSSFSSIPRGSPGPGKRPKRVPPVPTPQVGTATAKACTAAVTRSMSTPRRAELAAEMGVVRGEIGLGAGVVPGDEVLGDPEGHGRPHRENAIWLPASTFRTLPVDLAETSLAKKNTASAMSSG